MSGPKYYNFPVGSAEEAAGIYAQLASLQLGVRVRVVNNELQFTVAEWAWNAGVNRSTLQQQIDRARERYRQNEEMQRLLQEKKSQERMKVKGKIASIEDEYRREREKLERARARCVAVRNQATVSENTPFGSYDLRSELGKVDKTAEKIASELASLAKRREKCLAECREAERDMQNSDSLQALSRAQRKLESVSISSSDAADSVDVLERSVKDKAARMKSFASFLRKLYENMQDKDMTGYLSRVKACVEGVDIFDANAPKRIEELLKEIETEIALLKEREQARAQSREISEKVAEQVQALSELSDALRPVLESVNAESVTAANYAAKSAEAIKECEEAVSRIRGLEFISGQNAGALDRIARELMPLKSSVMSEQTFSRLEALRTRLHALEKECKEGNELYREFRAEYDKYEDSYVKLQGFLSADGSELDEDAEGALESPADLFLAYDDPKAQIEQLKQRNAEFARIVSECTQEGVCGAIAATVMANGSKGFKKEKRKDGSLHFTYVRPDAKGAIFDVACDTEGKTTIHPRGVKLCNGKTVISEKELKQVHEECEWAQEIHDTFTAIGMSDGGSYGEISDEETQAMYDEKEYFHLKTYDDSLLYLTLAGYSQEEIDLLLGDVAEHKKADEEEAEEGGSSARKGAAAAAKASKK